MASVHDAAKFILEQHGPIGAMKLQKLIYYSQAWGLVWDEAPLFNERIEAWCDGPVSPDLYKVTRDGGDVSKSPLGRSKNLTQDQKDTILAVLEHYGKRSGFWLSQLTHNEDPWKQARSGLADNEPSNNVITHESMRQYYSSLG